MKKNSIECQCRHEIENNLPRTRFCEKPCGYTDQIEITERPLDGCSCGGQVCPIDLLGEIAWVCSFCGRDHTSIVNKKQWKND